MLARDTNLAMPRVPSPLEIAYLGSASDLCQMVADGTFPARSAEIGAATSPRAGDGLIRLDAHGLVAYASPNALSAYHRMGYASDLVGLPLATATRDLLSDPFDARRGGRPDRRARWPGSTRCGWRCGPAGAVMLVRALPLRPRGDAAGALVLVRDITDLRRRDMALLSKDATIREIHHRVKNNLQTVAALLRLQARRTAIPEASRALAESVRRVNSIALVHETLSASVDERVDFDELVDKVLPVIGDGATAESRAKVRRDGSFGTLPAALATPLVLVLTELVHNALAHAFDPGQAGEVVVSAQRSAGPLRRRGGRRRPRAAAGFDLERRPTVWACRSCAPCWTRSWTRRWRSRPRPGRRDRGRDEALVAGALTFRPWSTVRARRGRRRGPSTPPPEQPPSAPGGTTAGPEPGAVRLRARGGGEGSS